MRYCPHCRNYFEGENPPYSVAVESDGTHVDPIIRNPAVMVVGTSEEKRR